MKLRQTELAHENRRLVTLLPPDSRVKVGSIISLKGDNTKWTVLSQSEPIESGEVNRGWNNNI